MKKVLYDEYVGKIKSCFLYYKNNNIKSVYYKLYLSSKKSNLVYKVPSESVASLLGVNVSFLERKRVVKSNSSFEMLEEFLHNANSIYDHFKGEVEAIFLDDIVERLSMFQKNIGLNFHEIQFVGEIDCSKIDFNHYDGEFIDANYIIIRYFPKDDCYSALLLKQNDKGTLCSVANLGHVGNLDPYRIYFKNQSCYLPDNGRIYSNMGEMLSSEYFSLEQKIEKMDQLCKMKDKYQFSLAVEKEYLDLLENKMKESRRIETILKMISILSDKETLLSYEEIEQAIDDQEVMEMFNPLIAQVQSMCKQNYDFWLQLKSNIERVQYLETSLTSQQPISNVEMHVQEDKIA